MTDSTEADIVIKHLIEQRDQARAERDAAARDMRERCAKVCMNLRHPDKSSESNDWIDGTEACANAVGALPLLATERAPE